MSIIFSRSLARYPDSEPVSTQEPSLSSLVGYCYWELIFLYFDSFKSEPLLRERMRTKLFRYTIPHTVKIRDELAFFAVSEAIIQSVTDIVR